MERLLPTGIAATTTYGLLVTCALITVRRGNRSANAYLAAFLGLFSIAVLFKVLQYDGTFYRHPQFLRLDAPFGFLYGPLLLFHVGCLLQGERHWPARKLSIHLVPALALTLYLLPYLLSPADAKRAALERGFLYFRKDQAVYSFFQNVHIAVYFVAAFLLFRTHRFGQKLPTPVERGWKLWLSVLGTYGAVIVTLAMLEVVFPNRVFGRWLIPTLSGLSFVVTTYFWFLFPEIFTVDISKGLTKYRKSGLDRGRLELIRQRLVTVIENERVYLNPNLSLDALAKSLAVSPNHLSEVINSAFGKSFFDLINQYRIRLAAKQLTDRRNQKSILEIAYDCGFNTKSTFYAAFKKEMGTTPTSFQRRSEVGV